MGNLICCGLQAAGCVLSTAFNCCLKAEGSNSVVSRLLYAFQLIFVAIISYILSRLPDWLKDNVDWWRYIPGLVGCPESLCYGTMASYRITFALACLHFILMIVMLGVRTKKDPRTSLQNGWWIIKAPLLLLIAVGSFFIPNSFFIPFGWISLFGASLFVVIQVVLLIDFAHSLNEKWVGKYDETKSRGWAILLVGLTVVLFLAFVVGTILMFVFFTNENGAKEHCWINSMFVTINIILCVAVSLFSINPTIQKKNPKSGIFQSAVVTFYCTYLVWSSISSEPTDWKCSILDSPSGPSLFIGVSISFLALVYSALRVSSSDLTGKKKEKKNAKQEAERKRLLKIANPDLDEEDLKKEDSNDLESGVPKEPKEPNDEESSKDEKEDEDKPVSYSYSYFHFTFFLAAMYLTMVITNWKLLIENNSEQEKPTISVDQGEISVWVKIISAWLTLIMYIWTLLAPIIFTERVFD